MELQMAKSQPTAEMKFTLTITDYDLISIPKKRIDEINKRLSDNGIPVSERLSQLAKMACIIELMEDII